MRRHKTLTSGESVSVEEPRVERILPRELLPWQTGVLAGQSKEGREPSGQGDRGAGQSGEDSRVMEAREAEAGGQTGEASGGRGGGARGGEARRGPGLIEGLELGQLVQVRGGGGPRGRDGPHQGGRGRGVRGPGGAPEVLGRGGGPASVEGGAVPG